MTLHDFLDCNYGADGEELLRRKLADGADPDSREGPLAETPLHVATRRRRAAAVGILIDAGADIDAKTAGGKTAYAHAARRGFDDVVTELAQRGADATLDAPDRFAVASVQGRLDEARRLLERHAGAIRTGNPEEDRLLADVAGRNETDVVEFLVTAGADLSAPGLDGGTPLHQAAWFGQPDNARILIDAGAPLDLFDPVHESSPVHWAAHGSRYSGEAEDRQDVYVAVTRMLVEAGSSLHYPGRPEDDAYVRRLLKDASPQVRDVLVRHLKSDPD